MATVYIRGWCYSTQRFQSYSVHLKVPSIRGSIYSWKYGVSVYACVCVCMCVRCVCVCACGLGLRAGDRGYFSSNESRIQVPLANRFFIAKTLCILEVGCSTTSHGWEPGFK